MPKTRYARDGRSPVPKNETVSRVMRANRSKHTSPEVSLRKGLRSAGLHDYTLHSPRLPGKPDVVFKKKRLAIFVNGCFWHRCPFCKQGIPKTNSAFWRNKFKNNVARDKKNVAALRRRGWHVTVVWECRLKKSVDRTVARIERSYLA